MEHYNELLREKIWRRKPLNILKLINQKKNKLNGARAFSKTALSCHLNVVFKFASHFCNK